MLCVGCLWSQSAERGAVPRVAPARECTGPVFVFVCLSHPPTLGGITLYLFVCVLCVLRSRPACVTSETDVETPTQVLRNKDPGYVSRDDYLTAKAGVRSEARVECDGRQREVGASPGGARKTARERAERGARRTARV